MWIWGLKGLRNTFVSRSLVKLGIHFSRKFPRPPIRPQGLYLKSYTSGLSCSKAGLRYPPDKSLSIELVLGRPIALYPVDSVLSSGQRYPPFKQLGPVLLVVLQRLLRKRMDHKNKFKNKARVIKYVLQVLKRSKEFLPLSLPHEVIL